jgi:hypothetical protein
LNIGRGTWRVKKAGGTIRRRDKKIGDAAWEDRIALCPVTVLTTVTENREQEVMLSSPVSLAPPESEQSRCHAAGGTHSGDDLSKNNEIAHFP